MDQAVRFKAMYSSLGFSAGDVANFLQVTSRTVQLWVSGRVRIPYAAFKLMRLMLHYELPGKAWEGWHLSAGRLYTPEGLELAPHEVSWWSLLVRQARSFRTLYAAKYPSSEAARLADGRGACAGPVGQPAASGLSDLAGAAGSAYAEPCPKSIALATTPPVRSTPDGNHGETLHFGGGLGPFWGLGSIKTAGFFGAPYAFKSLTWCQAGARMGPWHSTSDYPLPSILRPAPTANGSESASIPSSVSPLMPTCAGPIPLPRLHSPLHLLCSSHGKKPLRKGGKGSRALLSSGSESSFTMCIGTSFKTPCQSCRRSPRKPTGASSLSGTGATRQSDRGGA